MCALRPQALVVQKGQFMLVTLNGQLMGSCPILVINAEKGFKAEGRRQKAEVLKPLYHKKFGYFPSFFPSAFCPLPSALPQPRSPKIAKNQLMLVKG